MPNDPDWTDENFDAEAAKRLVSNLRDDKARLQESLVGERAKVSTLTEERDAAIERATTAEGDLDKVHRETTLKSALADYDLDLSDEEIVDLFEGLDQDAITARVDRLAKLAGKTKIDPKDKKDPKEKKDEKDPKDGQEPDPKADEPLEPDAGPLVRRPRPALVPGDSGSGDGGEPDVKAIAASIRENRR